MRYADIPGVAVDWEGNMRNVSENTYTLVLDGENDSTGLRLHEAIRWGAEAVAAGRHDSYEVWDEYTDTLVDSGSRPLRRH